MHSPRKVKPIVSSHKKATAPEKTTSKHLSDLTRKRPLLKKTNCCVISQERECSLKTDKDPNQNCPQQITKCEWISGTLSQQVAWLCDSRFLSQGVLYHPKRGQAVLQRIFKHFSYCPGDSTRSVQWVMIQDKQGRVLRSSVLDHSWTPFNQRPSDSLEIVVGHVKNF